MLLSLKPRAVERARRAPSARLMYKTSLAAIAVAAVVLNACSPPPAPRRTLNIEDKTADLYWLFSQFNEYYAPLTYKEGRFGFKHGELKAHYLQAAAQTNTNDEFYELMFSYVSEFKDAHTSASLSNSELPARAKVSYLGFSGKRVGEALQVTELLPTIKASSDYPIKVGDKITKLNGVALKAVVKAELVKWRDLGLDEANYTYHFNKIFNRVNTANGLPKDDTAVLTLLREGKERQVALPWIVKDLYAFNREQREATKKADVSESTEEAAIGRLFQLGYLRFDGKIEPSLSLIQKLVRELPDFSFWNTFQFVDTFPVWETKLLGDPTLRKGNDLVTGFEALSKARTVPPTAIPIADAKTYPVYLTREKVLDAEGKETGATRLVAYMYLNTFSPQGAEAAVLKEVESTLDKLKAFGVNDLVIDMLNNGGGSLLLGMKLAQLLSKEKVVQPDIQFRLSETWLDSFEKQSLMADNDAERELARRAFETLRADQSTGSRISRRIPVESLQPFGIDPNAKLEGKLNIVLMVNEMCASMCDIFAATLQDNGLAKIVGTKTMGAGGNVVEHYLAPNSHLTVRQTESLIVRKGGKKDGAYIENDGVEPDVEMKVNESVMEKYEPVRKAALKLLLTETK